MVKELKYLNNAYFYKHFKVFHFINMIVLSFRKSNECLKKKLPETTFFLKK